MTKKSLLIISSVTAAFLAITMVAMQFSEQVQWSAFDFILAAILLFGAGFAIDIVTRKIKSRNRRIAFLIAFVGLFLVVWAELAVGVFGTPLAGS